MEDKQCKQTERFLVIAQRSNYFLSLHDKSKQRCKVKIKEVLKLYESLESYNLLASGWVKEVKITLLLNYVLELPWLLDR